MSREEIKSYLGTKIEDYEDMIDEVSYAGLLNNVDIPESFDSRE